MRNNEAYLDALLNGNTKTKESPRQWLISHQDDIPLVILTSYLDRIRERMVIEDGRIKSFTTK